MDFAIRLWLFCLASLNVHKGMSNNLADYPNQFGRYGSLMFDSLPSDVDCFLILERELVITLVFLR